MFILFCILIIGIHLSPILFRSLDIWHAQGVWVQGMIAILLAWSFFEKPKYLIKKNIPLGLLFLWMSVNTGVICYLGQVNGYYDTAHFFPYFNFLCLLLLYRLITSHITFKQIEKILYILKYTVIFTLFVSTLQVFNLSQFFRIIDPTHSHHNNIVTGMLGNGTHLSGFLGMCAPLFFYKMKRIDKLSLVLLGLILLHTGTTIGDPSISGFIIVPLLFLYYYKDKFHVIWPILAMGLFIALWVYPNIPEQFFSFQGRPPLWKAYWPVYKLLPVTGAGLGTVGMVRKYVFPTATHLHLEYFEIALDLGLIGLVLVFNCIYEFLRTTAKDKLQLTLKTIVIGFLLSCSFNFPAHLWLPSTYAMIAYAGYMKRGS